MSVSLRIPTILRPLTALRWNVTRPDSRLRRCRWRGRATARWNERAADWTIHKILMLGKLPALFLDSGRARMARWPDELESARA